MHLWCQDVQITHAHVSKRGRLPHGKFVRQCSQLPSAQNLCCTLRGDGQRKSSGRPHRQVRETKGNGKWRQRCKNTRNKWGSILVASWDGVAINAAPANGPLPSHSAESAEGHDVGMQQAESLLERLPSDACQQEVTQIVSLPMRMEGLGIRSTSRMAPSAFWASWADALPMLQDRPPSISNQIADVLNGHRRLAAWENFKPSHKCSIATVSSAVQSGAHGGGSTSSPSTRSEQYFASSASEHHFRETVALAQIMCSRPSPFRSHSGAGSSDVL